MRLLNPFDSSWVILSVCCRDPVQPHFPSLPFSFRAPSLPSPLSPPPHPPSSLCAAAMDGPAVVPTADDHAYVNDGVTTPAVPARPTAASGPVTAPSSRPAGAPAGEGEGEPEDARKLVYKGPEFDTRQFFGRFWVSDEKPRDHGMETLKSFLALGNEQQKEMAALFKERCARPGKQAEREEEGEGERGGERGKGGKAKDKEKKRTTQAHSLSPSLPLSLLLLLSPPLPLSPSAAGRPLRRRTPRAWPSCTPRRRPSAETATGVLVLLCTHALPPVCPRTHTHTHTHARTHTRHVSQHA